MSVIGSHIGSKSGSRCNGMGIPGMNFDNMGGFDPMRALYEKKLAKQKQNSEHDCKECKQNGCEYCTHKFAQLPNCGEYCTVCHISYP